MEGARLQAGDIRSAVAATVAAIAPGTDVASIRPDQPLREQVDLDSMDWLNLVAGLHDRLGIDIPESDYGRLATLDAIVAYVAARRAKPRGKPRKRKAAAPAGVPQSTHLVRDTRVTIRPMRPDDKPLEADFVRHLSDDTRYDRFMVTMRELTPEKLRYFTEVDQVRHVALVAVAETGGAPVEVGVARYIVDPAGTGCEFAIAVDDAWHGSGLAGILMHALIDIARSRGLATMEGIVLATNNRMLKFTRQLGFTQARDPDDPTTFRVVRPLN